MEISLAAQLEKEARIDNSKNATSFVKSAPKQTRYSLADSAESEDIGMDYHIQMITSADKQRVLKFLRRFFFRDEPLNYSIGLIPEGEDSTCAELEDYCSQSTVDSNLSLMAVSTSGAIIGVLLNGISTPPDLNETEEPDYIKECKNPKFKKILRLLNHIDREVNADGKFQGKKVLETRIISVDSNWRGRGVGMALIRKTLEIAKEQSFDLVRMDCTSMFSAKLCIKNAYELVYELKHQDYLDEDGQPIFNPAYPHTTVQIYVKKL